MQRSVAARIAPQVERHDALIFDGDCRFCTAQVERLQRLARNKRAPLEAVPLQTEGLLEAVGISYDAAMSAMHLITDDGRVYRGIEAAVQALRHRPILGGLAKLYYVPGIRQLADLGYRIVARYRYALMGRAIARGECENGACAIHLRPPK